MRKAFAFCVACLAGSLLIAQKPFKEYPAIEYDAFPLPPDYNAKTDWVLGRLRYPDNVGYPFRSLVMNDGREFPGYWTMDYPRSDRHLLTGIRRAGADMIITYHAKDASRWLQE